MEFASIDCFCACCAVANRRLLLLRFATLLALASCSDFDPVAATIFLAPAFLPALFVAALPADRAPAAILPALREGSPAAADSLRLPSSDGFLASCREPFLPESAFDEFLIGVLAADSFAVAFFASDLRGGRVAAVCSDFVGFTFFLAAAAFAAFLPALAVARARAGALREGLEFFLAADASATFRTDFAIFRSFKRLILPAFTGLNGNQANCMPVIQSRSRQVKKNRHQRTATAPGTADFRKARSKSVIGPCREFRRPRCAPSPMPCARQGRHNATPCQFIEYIL